jgi:dCMP deaminase
MTFRIESTSITKLDERFCEMAELVSEWSKDPTSKVGAIICSKKDGDVSIGFNGFPMGVKDSPERLNDAEIKLELIVHAELNAVIAAGDRSIGGTLYVWGKPVCARCAGSIIQAGIKRVVALDPKSIDENSKWYKTGMVAIKMFREAGIKVDFYSIKTA